MSIEMVLALRTVSPLALHCTRAGTQYADVLDYIPGSTLRGALAENYLNENGLDDTFDDLFVSGRVCFGDLWPTLQGQGTVLLPATARACKRDGLGHIDSLSDTVLPALLSKESLKPEASCPDCKEPCDRINGYIAGLAQPELVSLTCRLRVGTAIERTTGTVARELLFSRNTRSTRKLVEPGGREILLQGTIRLREDALRSHLNNLLKTGTRLFLGSGRSRGLGEVELVYWEPLVQPVDPSLEIRWQQFNGRVQQIIGDTEDVRYFCLTLLSHLVLRDALLRPILGNVGPEHFGLPGSLTYVKRFISTVTVAGWNAALGLPKPDTVALSRGSVLLFQCSVAQEHAVLQRLAQIETEGVGERRSEGFGRISACHPFHYEYE